MRKPFIFALLSAGLATGQAAEAQLDAVLKPVSLGTAAASVKACLGAGADVAAAETRLAAAGWKKGSGPPAMRFFAHDGVLLMLVPGKAEGTWSCAQMIKLDKPTSGPELIAAMSGAFGVAPIRTPDGKIFWLMNGEGATVTGDDPEAPTQLRVIVGPTGDRK